MMTLKVNGHDHRIEAEPDTPLLYVLRDELKLNAAKFGCGLGQCGACTVIVDGKAYACHMAIAEEWKVWYLNADMAVSVPHRLEEALFMESFDLDFAARHAAALTEMSARIGLDYVAIDCAETRNGSLLIFEADNTAIVHDMDPPDIFPYKAPQMRKVFDAFVAMLDRRARQGRERAA